MTPTDMEIRETYDKYKKRSAGTRMPPFEKMKEQIKDGLTMQNMRAKINVAVSKLRERAKIEYIDRDLTDPKAPDMQNN